MIYASYKPQKLSSLLHVPINRYASSDGNSINALIKSKHMWYKSWVTYQSHLVIGKTVFWLLTCDLSVESPTGYLLKRSGAHLTQFCGVQSISSWTPTTLKLTSYFMKILRDINSTTNAAARTEGPLCSYHLKPVVLWTWLDFTMAVVSSPLRPPVSLLFETDSEWSD